MASIGSPQGISVPVAGTDGDVAAATKIVNALNTLIGAVEGQVPISAINWTAHASAGGYGLSALAYAGLNSQGAAGATAGRIENVNGDLYWINASGAVRITIGAALNFAAAGGIGGDYGGSNPALVSFSDANSLYEFTTDPGVFASVKANQFWITGSGAGVTKLDSAATGVQTWTLPALPGSQLILQVDGAGTVSASNTIPGALTLSAGATLAAGQTLKHPDKAMQLSTWDYRQAGGTLTPQTNGGVLGTAGASGDWQMGGLEVGTRIKSIKIRYSAAAADGKNLWLYKYVDGVQTLIQNTTNSTSGNIDIVLTLGTPEVVTTNVKYVITFSFGGAGADQMRNIEVTYDRV